MVASKLVGCVIQNNYLYQIKCEFLINKSFALQRNFISGKKSTALMNFVRIIKCALKRSRY